jgi:hypothetical protein
MSMKEGDVDEGRNGSRDPLSSNAPGAATVPEISDRSAPVEETSALANKSLPSLLGGDLRLFMGPDGTTYLHRFGHQQQPVLKVGSKECDGLLRRRSAEQGKLLKAKELQDLNDYLCGHAELMNDRRDVWYRVAPAEGGCEIDLGDAVMTRITVRAGEVTTHTEGSTTLFYRTPHMRPLPTPASPGDLRPLRKYFNLSAADFRLVVAWISYTLCHAKAATSKFPILVLHGVQGSGKSWACRVIQTLIDPSEILLQSFPRNEQDLAIAAQYGHVLIYDNLRSLSTAMSDKLCIASTGGTFATRKLFSDSGLVVLRLQAALVLNGIVSFVEQPDLAQRCLPVTLAPLEGNQLRDEATMVQEFEADLPYIFQGLLDLIACILRHLPTVEVLHPERMLDFVRWLAAMELADRVPPGVYQLQYCDALNEAMRESLESVPLAVAVLAFMEGKDDWSGTPRQLYVELDDRIDRRTSWSRDWPTNETAMGKQLRTLQAALLRQGLRLDFSRKRERIISIHQVEAGRNGR